MWPRSASSPSETSVIAVAPASAATAALTVGRFGHQVSTTQLFELANIFVPQSISSSGATQFADDGHRVARPGAATTHRFTTLQIAQHSHRNHPLRGAHQIPAGYTRAEQPRLVPQTVGQLERLRRRRVGGRTERDDERRRTGTHRLDIGGVLCDGLAAHVVRRRPIQAEVPPGHQHVGGHHCLAVAGEHDRGVVTGPQRHRGWLIAAGNQPVDDGELAGAREGLGVVVARHVTSVRLRYVWPAA